MLQYFRDGARPVRRQKRSHNGWWNLALAVAYGLGETAYFGWNLVPKSGAELACDGIALLLIIVTSNRIADSASPVNSENNHG